MKTALILIAVALIVVIGLGMSVRADLVSPDPFDLMDEMAAREDQSGGKMILSNTIYETCEGGIKVWRYKDGLKVYHRERVCWR